MGIILGKYKILIKTNGHCREVVSQESFTEEGISNFVTYRIVTLFGACTYK